MLKCESMFVSEHPGCSLCSDPLCAVMTDSAFGHFSVCVRALWQTAARAAEVSSYKGIAYSFFFLVPGLSVNKATNMLGADWELRRQI